MVMMRLKFVVPVILMAIMAFLVALSSARPLAGGEGWAEEAVESGESIIQLLRHLYLQQLQGPSCKTNSPNGGCPPPSMG